MPKCEVCLVVDVETAGGFSNPLVYDVGVAAVVRRTGKILESHSLIIADVFCDMPEQMATAYYANKVPEYRKGIRNGTHRLAKMWTVRRLMLGMIERYSVKRVYAYNAKFDRGALDNTFKVLTNGRGRSFLGRSVKWGCIWNLACNTVLSQKSYRKFAETHGFVSAAGNLRTSAEATYAYMMKNPEFVEPHTGLADVEIETEILAWCLRQHKPIREDLAHMPWKIPQRVA